MITFAGKFSKMVNFIDTHTHLYDEAFSGEEAEAVGRAVKAGVRKMILPDIDSSSRKAMLALASSFPGVLFPCIGLHPTSVGPGWKSELDMMEEHLGEDIKAIGETGMDLYWSKEYMSEQATVLEYHFRLAHRLDLPLIIHSREATGPIFNVLEKCRDISLKGVFHAFSGSAETFSRLQKYGDWYVGIGGVVTFRKASIAETLKQIPMDRILLETDSPYLTPVPKRGQRNESSYIPYIAGKIAEIKGTDIGEVAETTTANAQKLFRI